MVVCNRVRWLDRIEVDGALGNYRYDESWTLVHHETCMQVPDAQLVQVH